MIKAWGKAIESGDEIFLATKDFSKLTNNGNLTTYAYEVRYLIERKYKPINVTTKEWEQLQTLVEQLNFD